MNYNEKVLSLTKEPDIEMLRDSIQKLEECDTIETFCCQLYSISSLARRMHDVLRPYAIFPELIDKYVQWNDALDNKSS